MSLTLHYSQYESSVVKRNKLHVVGAGSAEVFWCWWRVWIIMWSRKIDSHTFKSVSFFKNWLSLSWSRFCTFYLTQKFILLDCIVNQISPFNTLTSVCLWPIVMLSTCVHIRFSYLSFANFKLRKHMYPGLSHWNLCWAEIFSSWAKRAWHFQYILLQILWRN